MLERGEHLRFATETREAIRIVGNGRKQGADLDADREAMINGEGAI